MSQKKGKRGTYHKWTPESDKFILKLRNEGHTVTYIAKEMGLSHGSVSNRLMRLGHTGPRKHKKQISEVANMAAEPVHKQSWISNTLNRLERYVTRLERENEMLKTRNSALEERLKKISSLVDQ